MEKYLAIVVGGFLLVVAVGIGISEYQKGQCRVESIKAGKSAEDIAKICR